MSYELIHLATPSATASEATAVLNNKGLVAGGWPSPAGPFEGLIWDASDGHIKSVVAPFAVTNVMAINDEGELLLKAAGPSGFPNWPALWRGGKLVDFASLFTSDFEPYDINAAGVISGTFFDGANFLPGILESRVTGARPRVLSLLPDTVQGSAGGIAADGTVVGACIRKDGSRIGCFWQHGNVHALGRGVLPNAINDRGQIAATYVGPTGTYVARIVDIRTTPATTHDLAPAAGRTHALLTGINNHGQVVGYTWSGSHTFEAYFFDGTTPQLVSSLISGETVPYTLATEINDAGQISATRAGRPILVVPQGSTHRLSAPILGPLLDIIAATGRGGDTDDWCLTGPKIHLPGGRWLPLPLQTPGRSRDALDSLPASSRQAIIAAALGGLSPLVSDPQIAQKLEHVAAELAALAVPRRSGA